ncbi:jg20197 [Pararge aegeria aegeria]|uniref:Jg20197 protein n=1 Tax=Pararge aegeria aegeria TaxID=348720 RepID=A0A8S4S4L0_9NEOP|nr:jg20197 [Pararge aegeria aegeria]
MSVQRVGDRPRDRLPSTFPWTTSRSMECLFLVMCPKNLRIRICTVDDNLSLTFNSSRIDTLGRKAVQGIRNSRRQHHISSASILRRSFKRTVHVSAPYRNIGKTKLLIRRTFVALVILRLYCGSETLKIVTSGGTSRGLL